MSKRAKRDEHGPVYVVTVPSASDNEPPKIIIEGGSLPREEAWVPKDGISVHNGETFMVMGTKAGRMGRLCGVPLLKLEWFSHIKELRDVECKRVYNAAIAEQGTEKGSKRKMTPSLTLPTTVGIDISLPGGGTYHLPVLFSSDFRQQVSFQLCENSLNRIVDAIRANTDKGTRHAKLPRSDRFESQYPEVYFSTARGYAFVLWADADGLVHRKSRRPWKTKPMDPEEAEEGLHQAAMWLHEFYVANHNGPDGLVLPPDNCDAVADQDDEDEEGGEGANVSPEGCDMSHASECSGDAPARADGD